MLQYVYPFLVICIIFFKSPLFYVYLKEMADDMFVPYLSFGVAKGPL